MANIALRPHAFGHENKAIFEDKGKKIEFEHFALADTNNDFIGKLLHLLPSNWAWFTFKLNIYLQVVFFFFKCRIGHCKADLEKLQQKVKL